VYEHGAAQVYTAAPGRLPTTPGEAVTPPPER